MSIYTEIKTERSKQDDEWGGPGHDDGHTTADWSEFIRNHVYRAETATTTETARYQFVRVAALAVAAIETLDRQVAARKEGERD